MSSAARSVNLYDSQVSGTSVYMSEMLIKLDQHAEALNSVESMDFDAIALSDITGRDHIFSTVVYKIINDLPKLNSTVVLNNDKLIAFLYAISTGYRKDVAYHNDLHGADVAQMMYLFVK